jgi:hypothetical protein
MLQTCRSWRTALQQCKAGNLTVRLPNIAGAAAEPSSVQSVRSVACFAGWLPQHAGLISGIRLLEPLGGYEQWPAYCDIAEQLLVFSLKEAAAYGRPLAAAELQLATFESTSMRSPALLHALPAAALTQLVLTHTESWRAGLHFNSSSFTAGLARLTALRELELYRGAAEEVRDPCLAAIGQLTNLSRVFLDINTDRDPIESSCNLQLLPQQLQQLELDAGSGAGMSIPFALEHITALRQLQLTLHCNPAPGSALPAGLTALTVRHCAEDSNVQHLGIPQLSQLQQLHAVACLHEPEQLQQLSSLSHLTHIELAYRRPWEALQAACTWRHLSALRSISLSMYEVPLDRQDSRALLEHLAAASSLQHLDFGGSFLHPTARVCNYIANLQQLQHLCLFGRHPCTRTGALALTKLTGLTALSLYGAAGVDDVAAAALAARLTKLRSLRLVDCSPVLTAAALPVIAALTGLTQLHLCYDSGDPIHLAQVTAEELLLLRPLAQLRELKCYGFVQSQAIEQLWDAKKGSWREQQ